MARLKSIDIVRGTVMIIMALDHVRDLMHVDSLTQNPTNLATTTPILFFTRWITHLCAPIFVFLAGASVYFSLKKSGNVASTRNHLFKRGLWLLLLEFTVVNFAMFFDLGFHTLIFEVIASTGLGFVILSLLLNWQSRYVGLLGLIIIFCHGLTPLIPFADDSTLKAVLTPFFSPTAIPIAGKTLIVGYPPVPWLGILLVGFASGSFFEVENGKKHAFFLKISLALATLFVLIRLTNVYGDAAPWATQKDAVFTFLSFINISKYPPSLIFCLITLSIMFLLLAFAERLPAGIQKITAVYGKVPLFYFVVHFYLIHILTLIMLLAQGFQWSQLEFATGTFGRPSGVESGIPLWLVYGVWMVVVVAMYKPCVWFGQYKEKHRKWWLRYL